LGFVTHGGDVGSECAAAEIIERGGPGRVGDAQDDWFQCGKDAQARALAEWYQADSGGNQVCRERLEIGCGGCTFRDAMSAGESTDCDGVRNACRQVGRIPCGGGSNEGSALV
jgi:hypothetical protein